MSRSIAAQATRRRSGMPPYIVFNDASLWKHAGRRHCRSFHDRGRDRRSWRMAGSSSADSAAIARILIARDVGRHVNRVVPLSCPAPVADTFANFELVPVIARLGQRLRAGGVKSSWPQQRSPDGRRATGGSRGVLVTSIRSGPRGARCRGFQLPGVSMSMSCGLAGGS